MMICCHFTIPNEITHTLSLDIPPFVFADSVIRMPADKIHVLASERSWVKSILDMLDPGNSRG